MTDRDYRHVRVDDIPDAPNPTRHKKEVDEAVGASAFGFNVYTADPGERVPWGYHRHPDHEELIYVLDGALEIETADDTVRVEGGEAFFVPPNAPQSARAIGDQPARFVAVGAPKTEDGSVIEERCPECGETTGRTHEAVDDGDTYILYCEDCGAETDRFHAGP